MTKRFALLLLAALGVGGCGSEDGRSEKSAPPGSAVLTPHARVLDAEGHDALQSFTSDGRLVFSGESPVLSALAAGDVLIVSVTDATPLGALVKVESVAREAGQVVVTSRRASLGDAFEELHVAYETTLTVRPPSAPASLAPGFSALQAGPVEQQGIAFPLRLEASDAGGSIVLDGALSLAPRVDLTIDVDFVRLELEELSLSFGARETFSANFTATGTTSFNESVTLASFPIGAPIILPLPTPVGVVPVVLAPNLSIGAGVSGTVQGNVATSVAQEAEFEVGLGYRNGSFGTISDSDSKFNVEPPTYEAAVSVKAHAGPRFEVLFWGLVGPYAEAEAYVELAASVEGPPPCVRGRVDAGLTASVGVDVVADFETRLLNEAYPLAGFDSCNSDPNAPRPAATWARSYGRDGSLGERAKAVVELSDGTLVIVGDSSLFEGVSGFAASMWAVRVDALGNVMWQRAYQRLSGLGLTQGAAGVDGGVLVLGSAGLMKLDPGGNLLWAKTYTGAQALDLASIAALSDGSAVVAGRVGTSTQAFAMSVNAAGDVQWAKTYGGADFASVKATRDGGSVHVGYTDTANGDMYVVKLDASGGVAWKRAIDNAYDSTAGMFPNPPVPSGDRGNDIAEKPNGGYVAVGTTYGAFPIPEPASGGYYAAWEVDLGSDGSLAGGSRVHRAPNDALYTNAYAVAIRPDGSSLIVGQRADQATDLLSSEDVLLIQGGTFAVLGGSGNDAVLSGALAGRASPLKLTRDGGAIVAATSTSFSGQEQFWVVKLGRTGSINFGYRTGIAGSSYTNEHASSVSLSSGATDIAITPVSFAPELRWETTPEVVQQQAP